MTLSMQAIRPLATILRPNLEQTKASQIGFTVLRVVVGTVMMHNGLDKLSDIEGFSQAYVELIGLPFPIFFSYVAAFTELLGAPLVAIGCLTRPAALGLLSTMAVAMYHHILVAGFNIPYLELSAVYASCFLFLTINGGGPFSIDALVGQWLTNKLSSAQAEKLTALEKSYQAATRATDSDATEAGTGVQ